jgi:TPR repeat protein
MWHEKAAEQDYGLGQYALGLLYLDGMGVAKDPAVGAIWMHKAASQGVVEAAFTLGAMYQKGEGVERNSLQAAEWYLRAAEQGHAFAQHNLAQMYADGEGVDQDEAEALRWERSAAELGDPNAQYRLGILYAQGQALPQDYDEAFGWIRKAAEQGYPLSFDFASGWRVGHYSARPNLGSIMEFVREGDDIESWQELLTLQLFTTSWGGRSPEATLNSLKAMREVQCPGVTQWEVIGQDATSILYEWRSGQCRGWPAQHEIAKIIYGKTARIRIAYTAKTDELNSEERTEWVDRIGRSRTDR